MSKLKISSEDKLNIILNKLVPAWKDCFSKETIEQAQTAKSQSRNYMFGVLMNERFIKLSRDCGGYKKGSTVSITDLYEDDSASNLVSLMIYRLGNSGYKKPIIVEG